MRYVLGFVCVLALGVMGCIEASGTGGSPGDGGGGMGGASGNAGNGASGGGVLESCEGADDLVACEGPGFSACINQICMIGDCAEAEEWAHCYAPASKGFFLGFCQAGTCVRECSVLELGDGCHTHFYGPGSSLRGICTETRYGVDCQPGCVSDTDCDDFNDCTVDRCLVSGACEPFPQQDGTLCAGGTCQVGECNLNTLEMPCTEQGVRNAARIGGGPFTFDCAGPRTILVDYRQEITFENDVGMDGGGKLTIASAGGPDGVVLVNEGTVAELTRLTLAGVDNYGTLELFDITLTGSFKGIRNRGAATLTNCTVSGNASGGIQNSRGATLTMVSCTIANNGYNGLRSIANEGGTLNASNSLVAGRCWQGDPWVAVSSLGHNIEHPEDTCGLDQPTDQVNVSVDDLKLGPLQDNGGPTATHALGLLPTPSVAIDRIPEAECLDADGVPLTTDQRGEERPVAILGAELKCDVGAFERQTDDP